MRVALALSRTLSTAFVYFCIVFFLLLFTTIIDSGSSTRLTLAVGDTAPSPLQWYEDSFLAVPIARDVCSLSQVGQRLPVGGSRSLEWEESKPR